MEFQQFYLGCLAHASYMVADAGQAVVIDPQRDVEQYLAWANQHGATIKAVIETHLHADFVSGHVELRQRTGAQVYIGHQAQAAFEHVPVRDGDELVVGNLVLHFLETPGHTPESVCIALTDPQKSQEPLLVFTGDTLFVGDVGRPDLVSTKGLSSTQMAQRMYHSLRRKLLSLPDAVQVYPAHGAGSACGKAISNKRSSTMGHERQHNWALQPMSESQFVSQLTQGLSAAPAYFAHDAELNRQGAVPLSKLTALSPLSAHAVQQAQAGGAQVLDVRDSVAFGAGHVAGALNIGLDGAFAAWAGRLLAFNRPIVVVATDADHAKEAAMRLARVGEESVVGYLENGMAGWHSEGFVLATLAQVSVRMLWQHMHTGVQLVDVRRLGEYQTAHVPGARHIELAALQKNLGALDPELPTYVICGSGYRSSAACSILAAAGFVDVSNVQGGTAAWQAAGLPTKAHRPPASATNPSTSSG